MDRFAQFRPVPLAKLLRSKLLQFYSDESGQTLVEFVLLAAVSIGVLVFIKDSIRSFTSKIWLGLAKKIAAPCHDTSACKPGAEIAL